MSGEEAKNGLTSSLRTEIVETQRTSADFLKWKLIATATVASIALGLWQAGGRYTGGGKLMACLIPLICAYVDLVSLDLGIRIFVIAAYLRQEHNDPYELYVQRTRRAGNPFRFAPIAVHASSIVVNLIIIGVGLAGANDPSWSRLEVCVYLLTGVLGMLITLLLWFAFSFKTAGLATNEERESGRPG